MRTPTDRTGLQAPSDSPPTGRSLTIDALIRRAAERDRAAEEREAPGRTVAAAVDADPTAHTATEVAALAAADRAGAAADRTAAAEDRDTLVGLLRGERTDGERGHPPGLTGREGQVLERLARAMTTRAIADDLILSPNSVKTHTQSIYRKIGVRTRAEAALWARDHGIG